MGTFETMQIKSFKHNGHIHRIWLENWLLPGELMDPAHASESFSILINSRTRIQEANGHEWTSRIPAVSFFIPGEWFNVIALLEEDGVRYYCNIASPPLVNGSVLTYIDYDLDVVVAAEGDYQIVDESEYQRHKQLYRYSQAVQRKVEEGLNKLIRRIERRLAPFSDRQVRRYFDCWQATVQER